VTNKDKPSSRIDKFIADCGREWRASKCVLCKVKKPEVNEDIREFVARYYSNKAGDASWRKFGFYLREAHGVGTQPESIIRHAKECLGLDVPKANG